MDEDSLCSWEGYILGIMTPGLFRGVTFGKFLNLFGLSFFLCRKRMIMIINSKIVVRIK